MKLERTTAPATEPITQTEVEDQLFLSTNYATSKVTKMIESARYHVEAYTDLALINQTWTMKLDSFPDVIYLPKGKVQSITSFSYLDSDGDTNTLVANTDYYLESTGIMARLVPVTSWPSPDTVRKGVVTVVWVAGFGAAASNVPAWAKEACLAHCTAAYEMKPDYLPFVEQLMMYHRVHFDYSIND